MFRAGLRGNSDDGVEVEKIWGWASSRMKSEELFAQTDGVGRRPSEVKRKIN